MQLPNWLNYKFILFLLLGKICFSQQWMPLGGGANDQVRDIWIDTITNELYACGNFTQIGGVASNGLAKWNGNTWTNLFPHQGFQQIYRVAKIDGVLYISGLFYMDGIQSYFAKNDGSGWIRDDRLSAFCLLYPFEDTLYLRYGEYTEIDGIPQSVLSKLVDGVWLPAIENYNLFGSSSNFKINELERYQGELILGGTFSNSEQSIVDICSYSDGVYTPLGEPFYASAIEELMEFQGNLFIGTNWYANNFPYNFLFAWNGEEYFNPFPDIEFRYQISDLQIINNELYISSAFNFKNDTAIYYLAKYDGVNFCAFGGWDDGVSTSNSSGFPNVRVFNNEIIATGLTIAGSPINWIAKWNGTTMDTCIYSPVTVSLKENGKNELKLFPNPTQNTLQVTFTSNQKISDDFIIYDQLGKVVFSQNFEIHIGENKLEIDLSSLKQGVYYTSLKNKTNYATTKLVKL